MFKKHDRNLNGFLSVLEYIACMGDSELGLKDYEIVSLAISADINGDGRIDYEEFMKHFAQNLRMVRFHHALQEAHRTYKSSVAPSSSKPSARGASAAAPQ